MASFSILFTSPLCRGEPTETTLASCNVFRVCLCERHFLKTRKNVLVLQEARRLLRDEAFLEAIKDRNVNLYNDLKDDIKREAVLNNMAKGKSDIVKYSLRFLPKNKTDKTIEVVQLFYDSNL